LKQFCVFSTILNKSKTKSITFQFIHHIVTFAQLLKKRMAKKKIVSDESEILTDAIIKGMQELKAQNIVVLNMRKLESTITDFFIICNGESNTQVEAIANSIRIEVQKTLGEPPYHEEGFSNSEWILLDYINVVAHIFQPQHRKFYNLEKLWADAEFKEIAA